MNIVATPGVASAPPALEAELLEDEPESMRRHHRQGEEQARAAADQRFRPDVSCRVAETGRDSEPSASSKQARERSGERRSQDAGHRTIQAATPSQEAWAAKG